MKRNNMLLLTGREKERAEGYLQRAIELARQAKCDDAHCGAVIARDDEIIGQGWNSPPSGSKKKRCHIPKTAYHARVTDKTCCIHAEIRAMHDALRQYPEKLLGSTLYFIRVDEQGEKKFSGAPYCTLCSKLVLDAGIQAFVLRTKEGIVSYGTDEYNELSFAYAD